MAAATEMKSPQTDVIILPLFGARLGLMRCPIRARLRRAPRLLNPSIRDRAPEHIRILPGRIRQDGHVPTEAPEDPAGNAVVNTQQSFKSSRSRGSTRAKRAIDFTVSFTNDNAWSGSLNSCKSLLKFGFVP
jgi:hypothetical protein